MSITGFWTRKKKIDILEMGDVEFLANHGDNAHYENTETALSLSGGDREVT